MKKGWLLLMVLSMIYFFAGCTQKVSYVQPSDVNYNFNNITAKNSFFWLTNSGLYYSYAPLKTTNYYSVTGEGTKTLASAESGAYSRIQTYKNMAYMLDFYDNSNDYSSTYRLHAYETNTGEHQEICYLENVHTFFVFDEQLYYLQDQFSEEGYNHSLHVYNLEDKTDVCIYKSVLTVGVMGDRVVFLVQNENLFTVYSATREPAVLGAFSYTLADGEEIGDMFNFTTNRIVLTINSDSSTKLVCYDLISDQQTEYGIDGYVYSAIVFEDFAFLIITDEPSAETDKQGNTIYRMNLKDGTKQKIVQMKGLVDSFVSSDGCIYVSSTVDRNIYRYDLDGNKALIYAF